MGHRWMQVTVALLAFGLVAHGQDAAEGVGAGLGAVAAKMLRSDDPEVTWQERRELRNQLGAQRALVRAEVDRVLRDQREPVLGLRYGSQLHTAIGVARDWRLSDSSGDLRRIVRCRLDLSSVPFGIRLGGADLYPAAKALASMPVRAERLFEGATDEDVPVLAWVLTESQGRDGAIALLKDCIARNRLDAARLGRAVELILATEHTSALLPPLPGVK